MTNANRKKALTAGLTVIELAFTISIVGLMMFFGLKGKVLVEAMRALAVSYELEQYQRLVLSYQVDYRNLPGDDLGAVKRWSRPPALSTIAPGTSVSLEANGAIDGKFFETGNPDGEQFAAWRDLRFSGALDGETSLVGISALPENPFGGFYGFDEGNLGQKGGSICASKIPGNAAIQIDKRLDDSRINSGRLVATSKFSIEDNNHFANPDSEPYNVEKEYIICVPLLP